MFAVSAVQLNEFQDANNDDYVQLGNVGNWDTDLISEVTDARSEQASADSAYQAAEEAWESARSDYATSIEMAWTTLSGDLEGRPSPEPELRTNRWADGEAAPPNHPDDEEFGVVRNGKFFRVLPKEEVTITWAEAQVVCEERGGQLASILSQDEDD